MDISKQLVLSPPVFALEINLKHLAHNIEIPLEGGFAPTVDPASLHFLDILHVKKLLHRELEEAGTLGVAEHSEGRGGSRPWQEGLRGGILIIISIFGFRVSLKKYLVTDALTH